MIYKNCNELPLSVFIKIVTTDNIALLVKEGTYSNKEINDAWANIYSEYFELCNSSDSKYMLNTAKAIAVAENKIIMINAAVAVLRLGHSDSMYKALEKLGFKARRIDDDEERGKELDKIVSRAKSLIHILNDAQRQMGDIDSGKKSTIQDYTHSIISLGKYQGYRIDPEITSVAEYLAIQRNYKMELEWQTKKA